MKPALARAFATSLRLAATFRLAASLRLVAAFSVAITTSSVAAPLAAQDGLPTLRDLGAEYTSPSGFLQFGLSGRLDVEAYLPGEDPAWIVPEVDPFVTGRLRLFADLYIGSELLFATEFRADGGEAPTSGALEARIEQTYLWWAPSPWVAIQIGKVPSPLGSYPTRHHTTRDPLIRPPITYEWRTMVCAPEVPANSGAFVDWKDDPDPARFRPIGAPPIWGAPYQWGAVLFGDLWGAGWTLSALNSAPSSEPDAWGWDPDRFETPSYAASVSYPFAPWLRATLYRGWGPYLEPDAVGPVPVGARLTDFQQVIWGADVAFDLGHWSVGVEAFHDRWEVPNVSDDPIDVSYSIEAVRTLAPGLFAAARYGAITFNRIEYRSSGYTGVGPEGIESWDYDTHRVQVGGGYRILGNLEGRAEYMWNWSDGPEDPADDLLSLQLWWEF